MTLEQMQERARNEIIKTVFGTADPSIEVVSKIDQLITEVWNEAEQNGIQIGRDMMEEEMKEKMKIVFGLELWELHKKHF